ncbi:hypothetical protein V5E97_04500 [Singulisphaera sp. Ch08]|uniref:Flagellar assembly protein T N-terminal domain-containing protein n=1 Tax=Singulisphaera sp. Ch08 TaxID=3120278 RepID=A0AAU7CID4_9BACT
MLRYPSRHYMKIRILFLVILLAVSAFASRPARAASDLNKELAEMAKKIKLLLDQKGLDAIAVGDFTAPAKLAASAGPAIAKCLAEELKTLGVTVKRRAELEVNGRYQDVDDKDTKLLAVQIKAHIVDHSGDEVLTLEPRAIFNITTIASLTGVTVTMPADGTDAERNEALADALDQPEVHLASTRISAATDSPYAIEIQVKTNEGYRPRAASKDEDGLAFLKIRRSEIYAIKLINDSPHDAAVTVTIDGLNIFAFSENKNYTHYIVPSKQSLLVPGWHRTNQVSDSFQVTEYSKSAVAEALSNSQSVGTITASFAAAWAKDAEPPDDEAPGRKGGRSGDATGKGPPVDFKLVEVVRDVGRLRSSVSVRYNKEEDPKDLPGGKP